MTARYWTNPSPGFLILGVAIPFASALRSRSRRSPGRKPQEAGLASGLDHTSQQIGGAVGIALLFFTIAVSTTDDALATGDAAPSALTDGFVNAFWAGAAIAFLASSSRSSSCAAAHLRAQEAEVLEPSLEEAA